MTDAVTTSTLAAADEGPRALLRDLGVAIGHLPTGPNNAITDVAGVKVGYSTVIKDEPYTSRTGVTVIIPGEQPTHKHPVFAGYHSFNGNGEMTGLLWVEESGMLTTPIAITNTHKVGTVRDALIQFEVKRSNFQKWMLPVVAETYDGRLNDLNAPNITAENVFEAMESAKSGVIAQGNVGGGTGMICHEFKGGTGTSSRVVKCGETKATVGVLVQANYGGRPTLRLDGVPIGQALPLTRIPSAWGPPTPKEGSIIIIVATDCPLLPHQCKRLSQRATVGLARTGGNGHNGSGDIFLSFSTGNAIPTEGDKPYPVQAMHNELMDPLFGAVAEAVEEAISNAMTSATTLTGYQGHTAHAIPLEPVVKLWKKHKEVGL